MQSNPKERGSINVTRQSNTQPKNPNCAWEDLVLNCTFRYIYCRVFKAKIIDIKGNDSQGGR